MSIRSIDDHAKPPTFATRPPWWMFPDRLILFVILPAAVVLLLAARRLIEANRIGYTSEVFIDWYYSAIVLAALLLMAGAAYLARQGPVSGQIPVLRRGALDFLFAGCAAGYAAWYIPLFISSPDLILRAFMADAGAVYELREQAPTIPGVTTLTQFGIAYAIVYGAAIFGYGERLSRRYHWFLAIILALSAFRAVTNSERIALIEVVFPLLVFMLRGNLYPASFAWNAVRSGLPLFMLAASPLFFAIFEYNRSWINHYQFEYDSYVRFVLDRWGFYYVTATNNLAGFLERTDWPSFQGEWTFQWLYRFPILKGWIFPEIQEGPFRYDIFLKEYAGEEFNNTTGILVVAYDWGILLGAVFFICYGLLCGFAFRSFVTGRGLLQYLLPMLLLFLLEILRIGYMYEGRAVAALIGLALVCKFQVSGQSLRAREA